jgi:transposase
MIQPVLGIDIAKETFDVCLIVGDKSWNNHFDNSLAGFRNLVHWVEKYTQEKVHACMEATGQYGNELAEFLYQQGNQVSVVNPARIKAYANSKLRRNKTDKADAQLIAEYCLREKPALWSPPPASFKDLQALVRRLDDLQVNYRQESNRLQSGCENQFVVEDLRNHLHFLEERIEQIKKSIQEHINSYPELKRRKELLTTIPGIGELTAAKVLGEIRDVCEFESARQLAAYAGVTPRNFISGTSVHKKSRLSKTGNSNLRKALYMPAVVAMKCNPIIRDFYQRLLLSGLRPMEAIGAAMHKLLRLIFGILKTGKPFDPNYLEKMAVTP